MGSNCSACRRHKVDSQVEPVCKACIDEAQEMARFLRDHGSCPTCKQPFGAAYAGCSNCYRARTAARDWA